MDSKKKLGLYIHIPFCANKCGYCDFYSVVPDHSGIVEAYFLKCREEIEDYAKQYASSREIHSIYIGGGTPSIVNPDDLGSLVKTIKDHWTIREECEITIEANPGTIRAEKLKVWREAGFNRLSVGVQSFSGEELEVIGRAGYVMDNGQWIMNNGRIGAEGKIQNTGYRKQKTEGRSSGNEERTLTVPLADRISPHGEGSRNPLFHSPPDEGGVMGALRLIKESGWENYGLDLMFGIPGQTLDNWENNLRKALEWKPKHLSVYGLTVEKGTPFEKKVSAGAVVMPDQELYNGMFVGAHEILTENGYEHYEVSNYCLPGYHSRHNTHYWEGGAYLGIGAGAVSYIDGKRWGNVKLKVESGKWKAGNQKDEESTPRYEWNEEIDKEKQINEMIMLGLRTFNGVNLESLKEMKCDLASEKEHFMKELKQKGYGEIYSTASGRYLRLSLKGMTVLDEITENLIR